MIDIDKILEKARKVNEEEREMLKKILEELIEIKLILNEIKDKLNNE